MSDSDDTDVLLLIPPDLFIVPSSDSEDDTRFSVGRNYHGTGVVSEILEHVKCLENRIIAIESRDNSLEVSLLNASLDSHSQAISHPIVEFPSTRQSQSQSHFCRLSSLPNTPVKPLHCSSTKSSPGCIPSSVKTNTPRRNERIFVGRSKHSDVTNHTNASSRIWQKQEDIINFGNTTNRTNRAHESPGIPSEVGKKFDTNILSDLTGRDKSAVCEREDRKTTLQTKEDKDVEEMELSEVDELLHEMEATEIELAKRINNSNARRCSEERVNIRSFGDSCDVSGRMLRERKFSTKSPMRRLDFQFADEELKKSFASLNLPRDKETPIYADISLQDDETSLPEETATRIADFKVWDSRAEGHARGKSDGTRTNFEKIDKYIAESESKNGNVNEYVDRGTNSFVDNSSKAAEHHRNPQNSEEFEKEIPISGAKKTNGSSLSNIKNSTMVQNALKDNGKIQGIDCVDDGSDGTFESALQNTRQSQCAEDLQQTIREIRMIGNQGSNSSVAKSTETCPRKIQRLLALSDFWDCDGTKSQEEMLRIRLEEEKFRREHCEHLIQELQKRLLEQQEKVAVAIRVDNEKNTIISQFQSAWSKLRQRWDTLEKDHSKLETNLKSVTDKHQAEVTEYQQQIKRGEGELSKALDLAAGYKEKSDSLVKEKLELLRSHADELEKYKSLVQEAEQRYENLKEDFNKLLEKNKQLEELSNNVQQELNKERLRSSEVRTEMGVIHKALDACEAELAILRQEKENLQLKIKEEKTRNGILEQNKIDLIAAAKESENSERAAREEIKLLVNRQDQIRSELREIYQNQLDEVVKTKLKEFQGQLDAAELAFQAELETRQRAIAECAARKFKSIIDKHQLEINLLEEKHNEEKRLSEIQLAQASQKAVMLEVQLSSQRAGKTQLAEQLHSVMQKQWQQALQIISGGQMENLSPLQRLNAEKMFESKNPKRCNSACCNKDHRSSRPELRSSSSQNLQNTNFRQEQDESLITLTSNDEAPLTRKGSEDDLRKYIKMILDMQQPKKDEFVRVKNTEENNSSPPPVTREVPRKHYTKKETNGLSEESVTWQRVDEQSGHDTSEYMQIPQSQGSKGDYHKNKPPWK